MRPPLTTSADNIEKDVPSPSSSKFYQYLLCQCFSGLSRSMSFYGTFLIEGNETNLKNHICKAIDFQKSKVSICPIVGIGLTPLQLFNFFLYFLYIKTFYVLSFTLISTDSIWYFLRIWAIAYISCHLTCWQLRTLISMHACHSSMVHIYSFCKCLTLVYHYLTLHNVLSSPFKLFALKNEKFSF